MLEGGVHQVLHGVGDAGGNHVVVGDVLLQHQPHRADVVAGKPPVALRVEVAERQMIGLPQLDLRHAVGHLAGDELEPAPRRLVIEEDSRDRVDAVALAIVHRDVVAEDLRHAVGAARIERRELGLRHLAHAAVHLARRGLIEPDLRVHLTHRFEQPRHAHRIEVAGEERLVPGGRHERHRRQVVELVGLHVLDHPHERQLVEQIRRTQRDAVEQVLDAPQVGRARAPDDAGHVVALVEQQLREVRPVLSGDARNDRALSH